MSNEENRKLRSSSRPSILKIMDPATISAHFGISLSSGSESSDKEFTPPPDSDVNDDSCSSLSDTHSSSESEEEEGNEEGDEGIGLDRADGTDDAGLLLNGEVGLASVSDHGDDDAAIDSTATRDDPKLCCVCLETSSHNDIVSCDNCGWSVHEGCYGVPDDTEDNEVDGTASDVSSFSTTPWFCDSCRAGVNNPSCELCPIEGGLFKQCVNGCWVHILCGLYCEGVEWVEPQLLTGMTLDDIPTTRWGSKKCVFCEDNWLGQTGVCLECDAGLCRTYFHATCAQKNGLLCEADDTSDGNKRKGSESDIGDTYFAHCLVHCDKGVAKKKKRKYNTMIKHVHSFKKSSDKRLEKYLIQAGEDYSKLYKRITEWYNPEDLVRKGERLLHHHPEAFKALTRKAQLLGYTSTDSLPRQRHHGGIITPNLTVEYVDFYNTRNKKIDSLKSDNNKLNEILHKLKENYKDCENKKKKFVSEINDLKKTRHDITTKITNLCNQANKLSDKEVIDINRYTLDDHAVNNDEENIINKTCCVCQCFDDDHLIIQCDTCNNFYHIHCLDPPLSKVPKKSSRYGWQCENCCFDSDDVLKPSVAEKTEPQSHFGRKINYTHTDSPWPYALEFSPFKEKNRNKKRKRK